MLKATRAAEDAGTTKPRRKSARLLEQHRGPDFDAALLPPHHLYTTRQLEGRLPILGRLIDMLHNYTRVYECIQPYSKEAHHLRHHHARTLSAKSQLEMAMRAAHDAVEELGDSIEDAHCCALDNIRNKKIEDSRWYRQQNLLSFPQDELELLFEDYQVEDAADFCAYLVDIVGASIDRPDYPVSDLIERFRILKRYLKRSSDPSTKYHLFQLLVTIVARHPVLIENFPRLPWRPDWMPQTDTDLSKFWGAAAARRELFKAYRKRNCNKVSSSRYHGEECFHSKYIDLLRGLQQRAHKEVRRAVLLAVGQSLSIELVDMIYSFTLQAEELPQTTEITKQPSKIIDIWDRDYDSEEALLEEYKCSSMKRHR